MRVPRIAAPTSSFTKGGMGNGGRFMLLMRARARVAPVAYTRASLPPTRMYSMAPNARWTSDSTTRQPPFSMGKGKARDVQHQLKQEHDERVDVEEHDESAATLKPRGKKAKKSVAEKFEALGLSAGLASQLATTFPHFTAPSSTQQHLIPAILAPNDVLLRSQTGSGKSIGILLALMAKPRLVFKTQGKTSAKSQHGISSLILVPTNELAEQYVSWAKQLLPESVASSLNSVIQAVMRGDQNRTPQQQIDDLLDNPPHILVATPRRALEILREPGVSGALGINNLRTLVLDEGDSILDLPGRYPSAKLVWKNLSHPPPGLEFLNEVMKVRGTYSGGEMLPSAGLEPASGKRGDERRPPEHIRRTQHKANDRSRMLAWLAPPKILRRSEVPLQIVACSATANSVLRHFFGAKTGWVRLGIWAQEQESLVLGRREAQRGGVRAQKAVTGRWIDLTGLSGMTGSRLNTEQQRDLNDSLAKRGELTMMPKELQHCCVVVDEGPPSDLNALPPMRNFSSKRVGRSLGMDPEAAAELTAMIDESDPALPPVNVKSRKARQVIKEVASMTTRSNLDRLVVPSYRHEPRSAIDDALIESLAYIFAIEGAMRSLVFIPPQWSLRNAQAKLSSMGVPVVDLSDLRTYSADATEPKISLIQSTSGRGLDIPHLSHVFILGTDALGDSIQYTHLAGRASRLSGFFSDAAISTSHIHRNPARVITLIRGLTVEDQIKNERTLDTWREFEDTTGKRMSGGVEGRKGKPMLISTAEQRISAVYHRLGLGAQRVKLGAADVALWSEEAMDGQEVEQDGQERGQDGAEVQAGEEKVLETDAKMQESQGEAVQEVVEEPQEVVIEQETTTQDANTRQ